MARPAKEGLDYFPLDVDINEDDKLVVPLAKYGVKGFGIIVRLMMAVYNNGYFYPWTEKEQYVFSDRVNVNIDEINEVIKECVKWGFFDAEIFQNQQILTSKGFQKRYIEAAKRRKEIYMIDEHVLVDIEHLCKKHNISILIVNADRNPINVDINEDIVEPMYTETPQSKVKESKVKNINKSTRQKPKYDEESTPYKMASYLHKKIMEHAIESGVGHLLEKTNLQSWSDDCRKLLEIDKVDKALVRDVIDWVTAHRFWKKNILSASKLREQFAKLAIEMNEEGKPILKPKNGTSGKNKIPIIKPEQDEVSDEEYAEILKLAQELEGK